VGSWRGWAYLFGFMVAFGEILHFVFHLSLVSLRAGILMIIYQSKFLDTIDPELSSFMRELFRSTQKTVEKSLKRAANPVNFGSE